MPALKPFFAFDQRETPLSFATRMAGLHIGASLVPFLHDMQIRPDDLAGCDVSAIERLAHISGIDQASLLHNAAVRVQKRHFNLRNNLLTSEFFSSPEMVFCPACLCEDDKRGADVASTRLGRLEWTLAPVRSCPVHGLALVRRKRQGWADKFLQLALIVPERGAALNELIDDAKQRSTSQLQDYILNRLESKVGPAWLDSQTLEQAARNTEMLGMRVKFGASKKLSDMTSDEWDAAGHVGYEITSGGETAIRDALFQMQTEFRGRAGKPGCRAIFGAIYESLSPKKNSKDPGDIKRIFQEHIVETMDVRVGQSILGTTLTERRLHSVQSLATEADLDPRTLRNVLAARGLIPVEQAISGHHVFDAEAGRKVAASVNRLTPITKLDEALGCARPLADQLVDERILLPIFDGPSTASGRTWKGVDSQKIERFLASLVADARSVDAAPIGMVPIAKAAEKAKLLCVEIVHLILGGFLENVARLTKVHGCSSILVDPVEVRLQSRAVLAGMSAFQAFGSLKIPRTSGWALAERHDGPRLDPLVIKSPNTCHLIHRFTCETVAAFVSEFTTDVRVANMYDLPKNVVVSQLKRARVRTVIPYAEIGIYLYRASDIPEMETA